MPGPGRQFEAGNKGGPGRTRGSGRIQLCKEFAEKEGFQKLIDLARGKGYKVGTLNGKVVEVGPSPELQFDALRLALAYGCGKPTDSIDITSGGETLYDFLRGQFSTNGHSSNGHVHAPTGSQQ